MKSRIDYYGDVLDMYELCCFLNISEPTARKLLENGEIKGKKVGRQWRILKQNVLDYLSCAS